MNKNKHLTQSERLAIELYLNRRFSFKAIGRELSKDPTTIAKEVKNHIVFKSSGAYGRPINDCLSRNSCIATNICGKKGCYNRSCKFCASTSCTTQCIAYQKVTCQYLKNHLTSATDVNYVETAHWRKSSISQPMHRKSMKWLE